MPDRLFRSAERWHLTGEMWMTFVKARDGGIAAVADLGYSSFTGTV